MFTLVSWGIALAGQKQEHSQGASLALADLDRALEIDAGYARAWNSRGLALKALGRDKEALAAFDQGAKDHGGFGEDTGKAGDSTY